MSEAIPANHCGRCGAVAYQSELARDSRGAMRPTGRYRCVQCKVVFSDVRQWRAFGAPLAAHGRAEGAGLLTG